MYINLTTLILLVLVSRPSAAQQSHLARIAEEPFARWYDSTVYDQSSAALNGATYPLLIRSRTGHQFFDSRDWKQGCVQINGRLITDQQMLFDIIDQQLVIQLPATGTDGLAPDMSAVESFSLAEHQFVRLDTKGKFHFYEILTSGDHLQLLAWHQKFLELKPTGYEVNKAVTYLLRYQDELYTLYARLNLTAIDPKIKDLYNKAKSRDAKFSIRKESKLINLIANLDELM